MHRNKLLKNYWWLNVHWQVALNKKIFRSSHCDFSFASFPSYPAIAGSEKRNSKDKQVNDEKMKSLSGCVAHQYETFLYDLDDAELQKKWFAVKQRLQWKHFTENVKKCVSFTTTIYFLGTQFLRWLCKCDPKHTDTVFQFQSTKKVDEIEAFIGLINYFIRKIPIYVAKTRNIIELRQRDKVLG